MRATSSANGDAVLDRSGGREHQDLALAPVRHERAADLVAAHVRQVAIEHEHVVVGDGDVRERRAPVVGEVNRDPLAAQPDGERLRQLHVILDEQHSHTSLPMLAGCTSRGYRPVTKPRHPEPCHPGVTGPRVQRAHEAFAQRNYSGEYARGAGDGGRRGAPRRLRR
jgi:hypothetical protein